MAQAAPPASHKTLGFTSLVCLIIANMVGAGVFTTSGFALGDLGTPNRVMAAWVVGGVIALSGALSYGGLVRRITDSGGEYLFLSRFIHPVAGFIAGWVSLLAGFTGAIAFAAPKNPRIPKILKKGVKDFIRFLGERENFAGFSYPLGCNRTTSFNRALSTCV